MGSCASKDGERATVERSRRRLSLSVGRGNRGAAELAKEGIDINRDQQPGPGQAEEGKQGGAEGEEEKTPTRRVSVSGKLSQEVQESFASKEFDLEGVAKVSELSSLGVGFACRKGLKPEAPNQDDFFIFRAEAPPYGPIGVYGVFDGHGPSGHRVSSFAQAEIPKILRELGGLQEDPQGTLTTAFEETHKSILQAAAQEENFDCQLSGATGTVALILPPLPPPPAEVSGEGEEAAEAGGKAGTPPGDPNDSKRRRLVVAHVGDSRCVLGKRKPLKPGEKEKERPDALLAVDLTEDHKPLRKDEKARIEAAGGEVKQLEGDIPHRVFMKDKLFPGLAMTRALGDKVGAQVGVIATPETKEIELGDDAFVILMCSDGVWEFIESQEAIDMIWKAVKKKAAKKEEIQGAVEALAYEAWRRWLKEEEDVVDDITVIAILL
uniref:PPM-type phosphatase domain-containing protein n=1 Tax=Chromera velia CCMP2878 TaxID=1169474 RepID=A0A0G4I8C2_9ALVE|eukprot:Cvel_1988.t1-p1 / transcript=Cvel_1988.t1 / gene=Cvel_1988 / organism=Chromera_velia_CCMP2878 / gene_product=Probable protein phosphatase 2C 65, putative / transcript_product=Probable protein phosphatase 2C 65, putative / location=Cvel_scaffold75:130525-136459(+) / protein_length=436 / sequence_SO=supercontig / SO=protein_coding / is_pseudo=false